MSKMGSELKFSYVSLRRRRVKHERYCRGGSHAEVKGLSFFTPISIIHWLKTTPKDSLISALFLCEAVPTRLKHSCGWVYWSRKRDIGGHQQLLLKYITGFFFYYYYDFEHLGVLVQLCFHLTGSRNDHLVNMRQCQNLKSWSLTAWKLLYLGCLVKLWELPTILVSFAESKAIGPNHRVQFFKVHQAGWLGCAELLTELLES